MKKIFIGVLLFVLIFNVSAEAKRRNGWYYGVNAGWYGLSGKVGYRDKNFNISVIDYSVPYHHRRSYYNDYIHRNWHYNPYYGNYYRYYDSEYYRKKDIAAINEIERLEQKKAGAEKAKSELAAVKVVRARFYKQYTTDTLPISMAEITIENASRHNITKVDFHGNIKTHKTSKVLIDEGFEYALPNTLGQGERATYKIPLNEFGSWSKVKAPDLAVFTVKVTGISTDTGAGIFSDFKSSDQKKLNDLKQKYIY